MFATELLTMAAEAGISPEEVYVDPIVTPVNVQQQQLMECIDFMQQLAEIGEVLAPGVQSTCGLSNVSNGAPEHLRPILNQTFMIILEKYGMTSAIVDAFDEDLRAIARGKRPEAVELVNKVVDGEDVDMSVLDEERKNYVKTVRVLLGRTLYSDSWLALD
jgi:5-methyltetrahydrofolate corrinoid/iron sulfur protein methyltransferase